MITILSVLVSLLSFRIRRRASVDRKTREGPREERTRAFGWDRSADHIRASSQPAALKGRIHGCTRTLRGNVQFFSLAPRAPDMHGSGLLLRKISIGAYSAGGNFPWGPLVECFRVLRACI